VLQALQDGCGLHEVAVFHGADASYRALLHAAFESAKIPIAAMPGTPLSETPAGRGVLALAERARLADDRPGGGDRRPRCR
jgi:hypothetical protein